MGCGNSTVAAGQNPPTPKNEGAGTATTGTGTGTGGAAEDNSVKPIAPDDPAVNGTNKPPATNGANGTAANKTDGADTKTADAKSKAPAPAATATATATATAAAGVDSKKQPTAAKTDSPLTAPTTTAATAKPVITATDSAKNKTASGGGPGVTATGAAAKKPTAAAAAGTPAQLTPDRALSGVAPTGNTPTTGKPPGAIIGATANGLPGAAKITALPGKTPSPNTTNAKKAGAGGTSEADDKLAPISLGPIMSLKGDRFAAALERELREDAAVWSHSTHSHHIVWCRRLILLCCTVLWMVYGCCAVVLCRAERSYG